MRSTRRTVSTPIQIGVIDDDSMLLQGMAAWLRDVPELRLAVAAADVESFLFRRVEVDVVLLDLNLRNGTVPAENVLALRDAGYAVLIVSVIGERGQVMACLDAGAAGYVLKRNDLQELVRNIRTVRNGGFALSKELALMISEDDRPSRPRLSEQELQIMRYYGRGFTLASAASRLGVKATTARTYAQRACAKYTALGRPTSTKQDLVQRWREDFPDAVD